MHDRNQTQAVFTDKAMAAAIGFAGVALALFWFMVAWRRAAVIQGWREQVLHLDGRVNRHAMYRRMEPKRAHLLVARLDKICDDTCSTRFLTRVGRDSSSPMLAGDL